METNRRPNDVEIIELKKKTLVDFKLSAATGAVALLSFFGMERTIALGGGDSVFYYITVIVFMTAAGSLALFIFISIYFLARPDLILNTPLKRVIIREIIRT